MIEFDAGVCGGSIETSPGDRMRAEVSPGLYCSGCGVMLMRGRRQDVSGPRARAPITSIVVCSECGARNSWSG